MINKKFFNCEVIAGGDDVHVDEYLKGISLTPEKIEALKKDPELLKVIEHQVKAKREANNEAKKYRETLEKSESEKKVREEEALKKKGEFETLYSKANEQLIAKDKKIKDVIIEKEVGIIATKLGIKNTSYLKLLDIKDLEVDLETFTVKGSESLVEKFKKENPDLFGEPKKLDVDGTKPKSKNGGIPEDDELKTLEAKALASKHPRDIAAWQNLKRELASK